MLFLKDMNYNIFQVDPYILNTVHFVGEHATTGKKLNSRHLAITVNI